ncbi:MAG: hypothetical protein ACI9Y1_002710 [Lentisphaeria bacterium]|jgi:uncharacterized protein YbbK (DUF523 family)
MNSSVTPHKIPVGISACLLGHKVRFDSGHKQNAYIVKTLGDYFEFKELCPEVDIGLGIPRETIRLVSDVQPDQQGVIPEGNICCVGSKIESLDVTEKLKSCANNQVHWHKDL